MSLIKEVIPSVQIPCGICGDYRIERVDQNIILENL